MIMREIRIPSEAEYRNFKGAHCWQQWASIHDDWQCPACKRMKREIMRWTLCTPGKLRFMGWAAGLHAHHDHSESQRFPQTILCEQCNNADGVVKRKLKLPKDFSFSPDEIGEFVKATPHGWHCIDFDTAFDIWLSI